MDYPPTALFRIGGRFAELGPTSCHRTHEIFSNHLGNWTVWVPRISAGRSDCPPWGLKLDRARTIAGRPRPPLAWINDGPDRRTGSGG